MLLQVVPDIAIVAVPHDAYLPIIKSLAKKHVHIIKEKPFATNMIEALEIHNVIKKYNVFLGIAVQRRFDPIFQSFLEFKRKIGKIFSIEGRYTLNIENLEHGISIDEFCKALHFIGLKEVDRPGSTAPAHNFPLFTEKSKIMPRLYNSSDRNQAHDDYSNAILFYKNAIKLPVWAFKDEENIVNTYIEGIKSICDLVMNNPTALKKDNQND